MSRKNRKYDREILPDRVYNSLLVAKFINNLMKKGKKSVAEHLFYGALEDIKQRVSDVEAVEVFNQAIENCKPQVEVKSRRVGGANYQIPVEVRPERRQALAFRWILDASRTRGEKTMQERLTAELLDAYNKSGSAIRKREEVHRMAEANKAFAHYRW